MKLYTDLEQSLKLAEFLPLESADMYYPWYIEEDGDTIESGHRITIPNIGNFTTHKVNKMILPCWSLAALLDVLPESIHDNNDNFSQLSITRKSVVYDDAFSEKITLGTIGSELIDACYEMIIKLHKMNLL